MLPLYIVPSQEKRDTLWCTTRLSRNSSFKKICFCQRCCKNVFQCAYIYLGTSYLWTAPTTGRAAVYYGMRWLMFFCWLSIYFYRSSSCKYSIDQFLKLEHIYLLTDTIYTTYLTYSTLLYSTLAGRSAMLVLVVQLIAKLGKWRSPTKHRAAGPFSRSR